MHITQREVYEKTIFALLFVFVTFGEFIVFIIFAGTTLKMWGKEEDGGRSGEGVPCDGYTVGTPETYLGESSVDLDRKDIYIVGEMGGIDVNTHVKEIVLAMITELHGVFKELVVSKGAFTDTPVHGPKCKDLRGRVDHDMHLGEINLMGYYPFEIKWSWGGKRNFMVNRLVMKGGVKSCSCSHEMQLQRKDE